MRADRTVGDFVTLVRGKTYKGNLVGKPGPALLGLGSIVPGGGFRNDYKTYGGDCPPELMLEPGDLYVSLKGATKDGEMIGSIARVPKTVPSGRLTQDTVRLVFQQRDIEFERFLYWLLRTQDYRSYCSARATGSAVVALSRNDFLAYPVPPLTTNRRQVVNLLENISDKIASNHRAIDQALALANALYARALTAGSQEAMVEDVAEFHNRRRIPLSRQEREARPGNIPYYGATGIFGYVDEFLFDEILVLVGEDGSVVRDDGGPVVQYIWGKAWINNHAHPLTGRGISNELLYVALGRSDIRPLVTGAVQRKVSMGNLKTLVLELPVEAARAELDGELASLFSLWRGRAEEIHLLQHLRDALLPELLAGRVRVPKAAGAVEAAA